MCGGSLRLAEPRLDRGALTWLEGRPAEGGRTVLMRAPLAGAGPAEVVSAAGADVRSRVHEYGGGAYLAAAGRLFAVHDADGAFHERGAEGWRRVAACLPGARYADGALSPDGRWLVAVEERPVAGGEPRNALVALDLRGGSRAVVEGRADFASSPRFSPDGSRLAWLAWNHPNMPWDGTRLWSTGWGPGGPTGAPRCVAGGDDESIFQPGFSPGGALVFASDRSGWWNLYREGPGGDVALRPHSAEYGRAQWLLGLSAWDFIGTDGVLCAVTREGSDRLVRLDLAGGRERELDLPFTAIEGVRAADGWACFVGASPHRAAALHLLCLADGRLRAVRASEAELEPEWIAAPEPLWVPSHGGRRAHVFLYRPRHPRCASRGERPPLVVRAHGGPHSAALPALEGTTQYWTSRGIAVADVNFAGSTGYGRAYRRLLDGQWGVADAEDCSAAARQLVREAGVDPARVAIRGSSAGGFTALSSLLHQAGFAAGASWYGIADLEALARDTHKFEAHLLERLVGPWPARRELYRARSPLHALERLRTPVILFQGLEDRVVPPGQAEALAAALAARGVPHAYLAFAGEGHGFRGADSRRLALEAELYFYGRRFGFEAEVGAEARARVDEALRGPAGRW